MGEEARQSGLAGGRGAVEGVSGAESGRGAGEGAGPGGRGAPAGGAAGRRLSGSSGVRREARLEQQGPGVLEGGETERPLRGAIWLNLPEGQA